MVITSYLFTVLAVLVSKRILRWLPIITWRDSYSHAATSTVLITVCAGRLNGWML